MDSLLAIKLIQKLLNSNCSQDKSKFFKMIVKRMDCCTTAFYEKPKYEISLNSMDDNLGISRLRFFKNKLPGNFKKLRDYELSKYLELFGIINNSLKMNYNVNIFKSVYALCYNTLWPVQIGIEIIDFEISLIKIYFSTIERPNFLKHKVIKKKLKRIAEILRLKNSYENLIFKQLDCIGFDFYPFGACGFKIYTFCHKPDRNKIELVKKEFIKQRRLVFYNKGTNILKLKEYFSLINNYSIKDLGLLYKINSESGINAIKFWTRFENPEALESFDNSIFKKYQRFSKAISMFKKFLVSESITVSYLSWDNCNFGIYLR